MNANDARRLAGEVMARTEPAPPVVTLASTPGQVYDAGQQHTGALRQWLSDRAALTEALIRWSE